jgi:hypothetical protein
MVRKRKFIKLSNIEKALIILAEHLELQPDNNYKVKQEILDILDIEEIKSPKTTNGKKIQRPNKEAL